MAKKTSSVFNTAGNGSYGKSAGMRMLGTAWKDLITVKTAAAILKCSSTRVGAHIKKKNLEYLQIDGVRFLSKKDVLRFKPKLEKRREFFASTR